VILKFRAPDILRALFWRLAAPAPLNECYARFSIPDSPMAKLTAIQASAIPRPAAYAGKDVRELHYEAGSIQRFSPVGRTSKSL